MSEPLGVIHVLVTGEPPEHGLLKHADQSMPAILASAGPGKRLARHHAETKRVVEFAVGEQSGVGGHDRTEKLKHQSPVEIEPEGLAVDSPVGFAIAASTNQAQNADNYA